MIKKVLLIQPPFSIMKTEPKMSMLPLGLAYIGAALEKNYEVRILDCLAEGYGTERELEDGLILIGLEPGQIERRIRDFGPDLVGISCLLSAQAGNSHETARIVKTVSADIITVMGGAHPSALPEVVLEDGNVDFAVIGEGEAVLSRLISSLNAREPLAGIDGLAYKENGSVRVNPKTTYIEDLDSLPYPARHLVPTDKYFSINKPLGYLTRRKPSLSVVTSRGCPAKCVFCSIHNIWGRKYRYRSAENVLDEIEFLLKKYGIRELQFVDDNLTMNRERAKKIFSGMIERKFNLLWTTPNGVAAWTLDDEMLGLMKKSGCYKLSLAVESGDEHVLHDIICKPVDLEKIPGLVKKIRKLGMGVDVFFIIGLPGETVDSMKKSLAFARSLAPDNLGIFIASPHPGTRLWDICVEKGYISRDIDFRNIRSRKITIETEDFTAADVARLVSRYNILYRFTLVRRPRVFYERVIKRLFRDPRFFFSLAWESIKKLR
ncbi:MAG: cobalamin-dependent protein [Elusimicrobia bacterium]|nr:cobalamin-dependent protein [Elusimicrobiota bacterium]